MRLEQLHVLYHENLYCWNSYYTTRTCAFGTTIIPREAGYLDDRCGWVRGPRAMHSFLILLAYVIFTDGINSFSIIIVIDYACIKIIFP